MEYPCRDPNDFTGDPLTFIQPRKVVISVIKKTVKLIYEPEIFLPEGSTYIVYINGVIIDRNGASEKVYTVSQTAGLNFAVVPIAPSIINPNYDPLCGIVVNMFNNIEKDVIEVGDGYIYPNIPTSIEYFDKIKLNYVPVSAGVLSKSIRRGSVARLAAGRRELVNGKFINKPAGDLRCVQKIQDYFYSTQYDQQANRTAPILTYSSYKLPAFRTARSVNLDNGKVPLDSVEVVKL
jgi:hypothetical protein